MALLIIGVPVFLVLLCIAIFLFFHAFKTVLGFNGTRAMLDFYWTTLLVLLWLGAAFGVVFVTFAIFSPVLEHFGNSDSKGGSVGPAIAVGLMLMSLMSAPLIATKLTSLVKKART